MHFHGLDILSTDQGDFAVVLVDQTADVIVCKEMREFGKKPLLSRTNLNVSVTQQGVFAINRGLPLVTNADARRIRSEVIQEIAKYPGILPEVVEIVQSSLRQSEGHPNCMGQ